MVGYPYNYGDRSSKQNHENQFLIFNLNPISEDSIIASSLPLPIFLDFQGTENAFGNEFNYELCNKITHLCQTFTQIPDTQTFILNYEDFSSLKMVLLLLNLTRKILLSG